MSEATSSKSRPRASTCPCLERPRHERVVGVGAVSHANRHDGHVTLVTMPRAELSESIQDYLKSVYKLQAEHGRVTIGALAKDLSVSPASASAMVKKLARARTAGARALSRRAADRVGRAGRAGGDSPPPAARAVSGEDARAARRRGARRGRPAGARDLRGARGAHRPRARLSDPRSARRPDPGREPRVAGYGCPKKKRSRGSSSSSRRNGLTFAAPPSSSETTASSSSVPFAASRQSSSSWPSQT